MIRLAGIFLLAALCAQGASTQSPKGTEQAMPNRYADLLPPPQPLAVVPPPQVYFFAATAQDKFGLLSDFSNEITLTNSTKARSVTLAWDASPGTNVITNYAAWDGPASRTYTNSANAGTNLTVSMQLLPPILTNVVLIVTSSNATNLLQASNVKGIWTLVGATNWTGTNLNVNRFWRGMGRSPASPARVYIRSILQ